MNNTTLFIMNFLNSSSIELLLSIFIYIFIILVFWLIPYLLGKRLGMIPAAIISIIILGVIGKLIHDYFLYIVNLKNFLRSATISMIVGISQGSKAKNKISKVSNDKNLEQN